MSDKLTFESVQPHIREGFDDIAFNKNLGLKLDQMGARELSARFDMQDHLLGNPFHKILHGGVSASVLDATAGVMASTSVMASIEDIDPADYEAFFASLNKMGTVGLHIDYLQPGRGESFCVTAKVLRVGSRVSAVQAELRNDSDELIAVGGGNFAWPGFQTSRP